jgi:hypothetical protein
MNIQIAPKTFHPIHRRNGSSSQQPRFNEVSPNRFFNSILRLVKEDIQNEPLYGSRDRDTWLRDIWPQEPYLAGVINSVTNIDKNRGWTVTGGRNQVKRFVNILHNNFFYAPDLSGWRMSFGGSSLSYWTADLGSVTEVGRLGNAEGPLDSLYFVDPTRCQLTGDFETPLKYFPESSRGNGIPFERDDYFRVVSLPSTDESKYGLGLCAVSRCIELAKIMLGIYQYDNEMLLNRAPRGLLLLKGITEQQWIDAMAARDAKLDGDEKRYYGAINVIASTDSEIAIDAQLTALSQLPAEFNQEVFTNLLMWGYALCFGYDPREFWPVSSGALGTATETEAQHRKAGAKGGLDFTLGYAEKLNQEMPDTVLFEFEERDLDGELANATVEQAQADVVTSMYESGLREGMPLINHEQAQILLAERGLIDSDWTLNQEDTVATDEGEERALDNERVQKAIWKFPDEPIVQYRFTVEKGKEVGRYRTLREPQSRKRGFVVAQPIRRQTEIDDYQQQLNALAQQAVAGEVTQAEFESSLGALTTAILTLSLLNGLDDTDNEAAQLLTDAALLILEDDSPEAQEAGLETLTDPIILEEALPLEASIELQDEIALALASTLATDIFVGQYENDPDGLATRLNMWGITAAGLFAAGQLIGHPEMLFTWHLGATANHCSDCLGFDGQTMTGAEWQATGLRPQSRDLECNGFFCDCSLTAA